MLYVIAILLALLCLIEIYKAKKEKVIVVVSAPKKGEKEGEAVKVTVVGKAKVNAAGELSELGGRPL